MYIPAVWCIELARKPQAQPRNSTRCARDLDFSRSKTFAFTAWLKAAKGTRLRAFGVSGLASRQQEQGLGLGLSGLAFRLKEQSLGDVGQVGGPFGLCCSKEHGWDLSYGAFIKKDPFAFRV